MLFNFKIEGTYNYIRLIISFVITLWVISLFEVVITKVPYPELATAIFSKLTNDFWFGLITGFILFPVYLLVNLLSKKWSLTTMIVFLIVIVLGQIALVKYSLSTLLNLGADLLGYSLDDIYSTVSASESFSITYFIPFMLFPVLLFLAYKVTKKHLPERILISGGLILALIFGGFTLVLEDLSNTKFQNKIAFLTQDIIKFQKEKRQLRTYGLNRSDYPLLKASNASKDVLSPFFNINKEKKPNIVILIVEGLGSEFIGDKAYSGFTPFLDGLISKSLYWENFVSNTGRTFGVIPSLLGSLPYGEKGFLELPKIPSHISLISVLKANGYTTSYYSGDQSSFDKKINFLEYNDIDHIIDENKYGPEYIKTADDANGFSWGYPDGEIFKKTLASLNNNKQPRLDIIMTLSNHEPFIFPNKAYFEGKVDSIINSNRNLNIPKKEIRENKNIYTSLFYTDHSIKGFMEAYSKRPDYNNTIFIITGDHRLIPITQKDKLCRFHVPLYIFSPMLKQPEKFKSISSHWDIAPSLLSFLKSNYTFGGIDKTSWMGKGLDTARHFRNIHKIPLMRYKGSLNDYIYKDYFYSDGELYKINEDFGTYKIKEKDLTKTIADSLMAFKRMNAYLTQHNKIFPDSLNIYVKPGIEFTKEQLARINRLTKGLTFDQIFEIARDNAFKKEYDTAQLLCDFILNEIPNHSDARTLKGRTLAWNGDYINAEAELINVTKRTPFYFDCYLALLDLYWWSNQDNKSETIYKEALKNNIENPDISFKMAKAYKRLKHIDRATILTDSLIKLYPENKEYLAYKQNLE